MEKTRVSIFERRMSCLDKLMLSVDEQNSAHIMTITIGEFVSSQFQNRYIDKIRAIRELCPTLSDKLQNKDAVDKLKKSLPAGAVSCVLKNGTGEQNVVELNNTATVDIDEKDNPTITDWESFKGELAKLPYVAYAGLSVTGRGCYAIIPVADAAKYTKHYLALIDEFAHMTFTFRQVGNSEPTVIKGITLDPAPKNIASKRFVSYDPNPYVNAEAEIYTQTVEPVKLFVPRYTPTYTGDFSVEQFFYNHNISFTKRTKQDGVQYEVTCPWADLHSSSSPRESCVFVNNAGRLGFKCFHGHCADKHWREYRTFYEPDAYNWEL